MKSRLGQTMFRNLTGKSLSEGQPRRLLTKLTNDHKIVSAAPLPISKTSPAPTLTFKANFQNKSTATYARVADSMTHVNQNRRSLQWFYDHPAIDVAAAKKSVRLTPATMLYTGGRPGNGEHILKTAQYLHKELPVRVAHRVASFRRLPFMVGCNPLILAVHELYIRTFYLLQDFPAVSSPLSTMLSASIPSQKYFAF